MKEKISVVITCKNEEFHIEKCLISIKAQTWKNLEIIVVDNNSTDKTKEISKKYTEHVYNFGPERSAQRNYGLINIASGDYGIYIDADMILSPILLEECLRQIKKDKSDALHIPELILGNTYFSKIRRFERFFYSGTVIDGARFFRLDLFKKLGGFDEKLFQIGSGEDWDIDKTIKNHGKISLLNENSLENWVSEWVFKEFVESNGIIFKENYCGFYHNESSVKLKNYLHKKKYYSLGFDGYIKKWGKNDSDIRKQFGFLYRYLLVYVENGKWKFFFKRPDMIAGLYVVRFFVGLNYLIIRFKHD